jgi:glutamate racemase
MTQDSQTAMLPIGLFDSGVGGLTVLAALRQRLPRECYLYLGDTARLPYGTKSQSTVVRYSLQATQKLVERHIKCLVVACNTATAAALRVLQEVYAPLPVIGVVEPGARAACRAVNGKADGGRIIVMATESTIQAEAYTKAIHALRPAAEVTGIPCSLFVSLAEEGWMNGPIAEGIARRYLQPVMEAMRRDGRGGPDCILLGCTHFPPLAEAIAAVAGPDVILVDSAATTAEAVEEELRRRNLLRPIYTPPQEETPPPPPSTTAPGESDVCRLVQFLTTDAPERFARVGSLFLGCPIDLSELELVAL